MAHMATVIRQEVRFNGHAVAIFDRGGIGKYDQVIERRYTVWKEAVEDRFVIHDPSTGGNYTAKFMLPIVRLMAERNMKEWDLKY